MSHVLILTSGRAASTSMARAMAAPGELESAETLWGRQFPTAELPAVYRTLFRKPRSGMPGFYQFFLDYLDVPKVAKIFVPDVTDNVAELVSIARRNGGVIVGVTRDDIAAAAMSYCLAQQTGVFDPETQTGRAPRADLITQDKIDAAAARLQGSMTALRSMGPDIEVTYEQLVRGNNAPSSEFESIVGRPWPSITPRPF